MKRAFCIGVVLLVSVAASADVSFSAGLGPVYMPGAPDPLRLALYDDQLNNAGVEGLEAKEIRQVDYLGFHLFGQVNTGFFMTRLSVTAALPTLSSYTYLDDSGGTEVPVSVEHKAGLVYGTLWLGPRLEFAGAGSIYFCIGPTYLYAQWRDKVEVQDDPGLSKDRQYIGSGAVLPVLFGVEALVSDRIGLSLEAAFFGQQIVISTFGKPDFDAADSEHDSLPFPFSSYLDLFSTALGSAAFPFWIQLAVSYHL